MGCIPKYILIAVCCILHSGKLSASQFYGGELSYKFTGTTSTSNIYQITYKIYRNCKSYAELNSPVIWFFNAADNTNPTAVFKLEPSLISKERLSLTKANYCIINPPDLCSDLIIYSGSIELPFSDKGYLLYVSDCCRARENVNLLSESWNSGIEIIAGIPEGGQSITYYTKIPPHNSVPVNSSPVAQSDSIITACLGKQVQYQFNYIDPDGDQLSYSFADAAGKTNIGISVLRNIYFADAYSTLEPFGSSNGFLLDPNTGLLTGTPTTVGNFNIVLEIAESRNGHKIATHRKEFTLNVVQCKGYLIPPPIVCQNSPTFFSNNPNNTALKYSWDFGVVGTNADTSAAVYPFFTYPRSGDYPVTLIVTNDLGCKDTAKTIAKYYPDLLVDFDFKDSICNGGQLLMNNKSFFPSGTITSYQWNYISGRGTVNFSRDRNPVFGYIFNDTIPVGYSIQLIVNTDKGCRATVTKVPFVYPIPNAYAGRDTTISFDIPYEIPIKNSLQNSYLWKPAFGLSDTRIANPLVSGGGNQCYTLTVFGKDSLCKSYDTICISYGRGPAVHVPTAFSPNGDGINDQFRIRPVQIQVISFEIFNRYGNKVFSTDNPAASWDGKANGIPQPAGVFVWVIRGYGPSKSPYSESGSVLLIR